jgi:hypothetical protein
LRFSICDDAKKAKAKKAAADKKADAKKAAAEKKEAAPVK